MTKLQHLIEAGLAQFALFIFGLLPFAVASNLGGFIGRKIGPLMKAHKTARNNIKRTMPELSNDEVTKILEGMWDNLGRLLTEYVHIGRLNEAKAKSLVEIEGMEYFQAMAKNNGSFIVTGHFANWEILPVICYYHNCPLHIVYRTANNPYVDKIIYNIRAKHHAASSAKGSVGARQIINSLKNGGHIAMLVDQKQNDGISVPFFGIPAMTAPAIANLALKYDCPIYPARIVRNGSKFKAIFTPPIVLSSSDNKQDDALKAMITINSILEGWIREHPEQWFWVHNRWPKAL